MGFMKAEMGAIRAGMFALQHMLAAQVEAQDTITVSALVAGIEDLVDGIEERRKGDGRFAPTSIQGIHKIEQLMAHEGKEACPFCGCHEVEGDEYREEEDCILQHMQCVSCEGTWDNHYVLVEQYEL